MTLLEVEDLGIAYGGCEEAAVKNLDFSVGTGESVGIVGESGAGKSQTALAILGLLPATAQVTGSIRLAGTQIVGASPATLRNLRATKISMIFQDPATALNPYVTVGNQLRRILLEHRLCEKRQLRSACIEMLERVGLPDPDILFKAYPHQLSGGMRQRVLIAAALIGRPELIVADEPTTALDVTIQAQILMLLRSLQQELDMALLLITHDLGVIAQSCERMLVMDRGKVIEEGPCTTVLTKPTHWHTARLIDAVSRIDAPAPPARAPDTDKPVLEVSGLSVTFKSRRRVGHRIRKGHFGQARFVAVQPMDLTVSAGETLAIVGESGSGKTSLARSIAGLTPCDSGVVALDGCRLATQVEVRPKKIRRQLQMVFQEPVSSLNPAMRVDRIIAEPLTVHGGRQGSVRQTVAEVLDRVGLDPHLGDRFPHELSGGQAQRVAIARALVTEPRVLICDEALAALDGTVRREIIALLKAEQARARLALIIITHDLGVVREIGDRVIVMREGEVCEIATNEELFSKPQHSYTQALLAAVPALPLTIAIGA